MTAEKHTALVDAFREYLETNTTDGLAEDAPADESIDLYTLFVELAGLRTEVKHESRLVKSALDQFAGTSDTLQQGQGSLERAVHELRETLKQQRRETLRPLLVELLELHDRIEAGIERLGVLQPPGPQWWRPRRRAQIDALCDGQRMILRRLQRLLEHYGVAAINALGQRLDPHTMRALGTEQRAGLDDGIVTDELRKGFRWNDDILRQAEVTVNRSNQVRDKDNE